MSTPAAAPDTISHYTSVGGLLGIVESRAFHASHIQQMNDGAETQLGLKHINSVLFDRKELLSVQVNKLHTREEYFVASFSKARDSMLLWDRYKAEIEMIFDAAALHSAIDVHNEFTVDLNKVTYDEADISIAIDDILTRYPHELGGLSEIASLVASHKGDAWGAEEEWRFVTRLDPNHKPGHESLLKFKQGRYGITPYVELSFGPKDRPIPFSMLNVVRVGPGHHQQEIVQALKVLAYQHGREDMRGDYWTIEASDMPLRLP